MASYTYATDATVCVLKARAGADAVQAVVRRAAERIAQGARDVLVLAPSRTASDAVRARLCAELGDAVHEVRVTTPRALALQILDCDEAWGQTGRRARILTGFELAFLNEDLGVLGIKGRRVREMVKFLERGWSEMREDEQDWLVTGEEMAFERHLKSRLAFLEALHPAEVEATCVRYLAGSSVALDKARCDDVFVCDARSMGRAAQILACMVAGRSLTVAWDEAGALAGEDPYAYEAGLDELLAANPQAQVVELTQAPVSAEVFGVVKNLIAHRQPADAPQAAQLACDAAPGVFEVIDAGLLADEIPSVVSAVRARIDAGMAPADVFVAVPTDAWARRVRAALAQAGIACSAVEERQALNCDVRDAAKARAACAFTALELVANPQSAVAWRCWCGYGDYLTHAGDFSDLCEAGQRSGRGLIQELDALAVAAPDSEIAQCYRAGRSMVEAASGLTGSALVAHVCRAANGSGEVPPALAALLGRIADDEDAASLYARASLALTAPGFDPAGVRVGSWDRLLGAAPAAVVFAGMVNGLVPDRSYFDLTQLSIDGRAKMRSRLLRRLTAASCHAAADIVCTTFSRAGLVEAETLKLDSERIQLVDGRRMCRISPSLCIEFMRG